MKNNRKKPWPTKAVMNQIYEKHFWGGHTFDFYSGTGSHDLQIIKPYLKRVTEFLESQDSSLRVCDLGCGDFNIGKHLINFTKHYVAVDIVDRLIERNKTLYKAKHLEFQCLDIIEDVLPPADCIILRQVLQHLSNTDIQKVTKKLAAYKYIILTEHIPLGNFKPNKDIVSGQGIRLKQNSGVNILKPPFNLKIKAQTQLGAHFLGDGKGQIVTTLFRVF